MLAVGTPLALMASRVPRRVWQAAWIAGAIAAIGLVVLDSGVAATITIVPYACVAVGTGVIGLRRFLAGYRVPAELAASAGLMFLPAATAWLVAARAGFALLGYPPFWVILTCAHFHVAGCFLMTIAGTVARTRGRIAGVIALAVVLAVPLTAAGIYGPRWLEIGAGVMMATSGFATGVLLVTDRGLVRVAGAILLVTMPLAGMFALRDHGTSVTIFGLEPLASMMIAHGMPNTLLFALIALLALARRKVATGDDSGMIS